MKPSILFTSIVVCLTMTLTSCNSKNDNTPPQVTQVQQDEVQNEVPIVHGLKITNQYLAQLTSATSKETKSIALKNLLLSDMNANDLEMILALKAEMKIDDTDFRTLFWGQKRNKSVLEETVNDLELKQINFTRLDISKLDRAMIQSIANDNISYDQLNEEFKNDFNLNNNIQTQLTDEFVRIFNRDFLQIINDKTPYIQKGNYYFDLILGALDGKGNLAEIKHHSELQNRIFGLLKLASYNQILSRNSLITHSNNSVENRNITSAFSIWYSMDLGRAGNIHDTVNFNENLDQHFGQKNHTETPTQILLDVASNVNKSSAGYNVEILLNSFVLGGYNSDRKENETGRLNYNLSEKIVVPQCLNPAICSQFINLQKVYPQNEFTGSTRSYTDIVLKVNGQSLEQDLGSAVVDVSKQDAIIELSLSGNKSHVGAFGFAPASYQAVAFSINTNYNYKSDAIANVEVSKTIKSLIGTNDLELKQFVREQNPQNLKKVIEQSLLNSAKGEDYRSLYYSTLLFLKSTEEQGVKDPSAATKLMGLEDYLSNEIGRKIILPVVMSKINAYENMSVAKSEEEIKMLYQNLLKITFDNRLSKDEIKNKLQDTFIDNDNQAQELKELAKNLMELVAQSNLPAEALLHEINSYMTNVTSANQKILAEIALLNIEKKQLGK